MPSKIVDEVLQAITGQLFQGIDSSEHNMIPAVMQQKVAKELKNVLRNAGISGDTSLRDVVLPLANNEFGCPGNERSEAPFSILAPAGDNNAGEAQDDTAAPLTGDWSLDQFNPAARPPKSSYAWCAICERWQSNSSQHKRQHVNREPVLCPEPLLGGVPGMLCLEQFQDQTALRCHILRDHGRHTSNAYKGGIRVDSSAGNVLVRNANGKSED